MERKEKIDMVHRRIDFSPHMLVNAQTCESCTGQDCLFFCPASCFELDEEDHVAFHYEGCFECGTCRVMCSTGVESWNYPRGGNGVFYRLG